MEIRIISQPATGAGAFKANRRMPGGKPCGLLWHSTGADNPWVRRYCGLANTPAPIGSNPNGNGFMNGSTDVCSNAVMGLGTDGKMLTVKILPDDVCPWCSGSGNPDVAKANGFSGGSANFLSFYQVEVCEDKSCTGTVYGVKNPYNPKEYADMCYSEMVAFSVDFFKTHFSGPPEVITSKTLTSHIEGNKMGIASNHADPWHWLGKYGYSGDTLRRDVKTELQKQSGKSTSLKPSEPATTYIVVSGDTMTGIAKRFGVSLEALIAGNRLIENVNLISVGQKINIPKK